MDTTHLATGGVSVSVPSHTRSIHSSSCTKTTFVAIHLEMLEKSLSTYMENIFVIDQTHVSNLSIVYWGNLEFSKPHQLSFYCNAITLKRMPTRNWK